MKKIALTLIFATAAIFAAEANATAAKADANKTEANATAATAAAPSTAACVACHGAKFEKNTMAKDKVPANLSKADFAKALKGYKDGSYGGAMKGVMKGQVANLSDADIKAIADKFGK
jgi:cytochrome c553